MDNAPAPENRRGGLALGVILLGLVCIVVGFGVLTWTPRDTSVALAMATSAISPTVLPVSGSRSTPTAVTTGAPSATPTVAPSATPTATLMPSRLPALALIATSTNTPPPSPTPTRKAPAAPEGTSLSLTIVHSNDTWGYTRPCG